MGLHCDAGAISHVTAVVVGCLQIDRLHSSDTVKLFFEAKDYV